MEARCVTLERANLSDFRGAAGGRKFFDPFRIKPSSTEPRRETNVQQLAIKVQYIVSKRQHPAVGPWPWA